MLPSFIPSLPMLFSTPFACRCITEYLLFEFCRQAVFAHVQISYFYTLIFCRALVGVMVIALMYDTQVAGSNPDTSSKIFTHVIVPRPGLTRPMIEYLFFSGWGSYRRLSTMLVTSSWIPLAVKWIGYNPIHTNRLMEMGQL